MLCHIFNYVGRLTESSSKMAHKLASCALVVLILNVLSINGALVVPSVVNSNGAIPFAASLRAPRHFCGGSIIGQSWIITGAHCFEEIIDQSGVKVVVGTDVYNKGGESYDVEKVILHPKYNSGNKTEHDLALIKVAQPIKLNENVSFIPMSKESISGMTKEVYAEAWVPTKVSFF